MSNFKQYISEEGARELADLRVNFVQMPATEGSAPIRMLARVPSEECGCPEELWHYEGMLALIHLEADGKSEIHVWAGDWEMTKVTIHDNLHDLRAAMFQWLATVANPLKAVELDWDHNPALATAQAVGRRGTYMCVRTAFDISVLSLDGVELHRCSSGGHAANKARAQDHENTPLTPDEGRG